MLSDGFANFFIGDIVGVGDAEDSSEAGSMIHIHTGRWKGPVHVKATLWTSAMFLSLQIGFSFANAVDVCADLARISVFDPSSLMMAPRYLNCFTVTSSFALSHGRSLISGVFSK